MYTVMASVGVSVEGQGRGRGRVSEILIDSLPSAAVCNVALPPQEVLFSQIKQFINCSDQRSNR